MNSLNHDLNDDRADMQKWISHRNANIPMSEMDFLFALPPLDLSEEDHSWIDDRWFKSK